MNQVKTSHRPSLAEGRIKRIVASTILFFTILVVQAWGDLTGRWSCNDGGTYYLRQTGEVVHWYGEANGASPAWANVFYGRIRRDRIEGSWADVPKGRATGSGNLELVLNRQGTVLRVTTQTGGFNGSRCTRLAAEAEATQPLDRLRPEGGEDCVRFDPDAMNVQRVNGRWRLVEGNHWLFDCGPNPVAAQKALDVVRHYRMDRVCYVGGPDASFTYLLAKGGSPHGPLTGEDCVAFDPRKLAVSRIQGRWKIVAGRRGLFDFDQSQSEARTALAVIRRHGFTQRCFVGRPEADFTYLRR